MRRDYTAASSFAWLCRANDSLQAGLPISLNDSPCEYDVIEQAAMAVGRPGIRSCTEIAQIVQSSAGPGIPGHSGIGHVPCIYYDYRFEQLFRHGCLLSICGEQASLAYDGLRRTVQHAGPWWPFANAAILCDRPRDAHRDSEAASTVRTVQRSHFAMEWNCSPGMGRGCRLKRFYARRLSNIPRSALRATPRCARHSSKSTARSGMKASAGRHRLVNVETRS